MEHFFSPNSVEDHFFPPISSRDLRSDTHQSQIIGGDTDEDHTQIIGGDTVKLLGIYSPIPLPPPPRVSAPLAHRRGHQNNEVSRVVCDVINCSPIDCPTFQRCLFCSLTKVRNCLDLHWFVARS